MNRRLAPFWKARILGVASFCAMSALAAGAQVPPAPDDNARLDLPAGAWAVERATGVGGPAPAPELRARVMVDRTSLTPADTVRVRLVVVAPVGAKVTMPDLPKSIGDDLTLLSALSRREHQGSPVRQVITHELVLAPFMPGERTIPSWSISCAVTGDPGTKVLRLRTEAVKLTVESTLPKDGSVPELRAKPAGETIGDATTDTRDQSGVRRWMLGVGVASAAALVMAIIALLRTRRGVAADPLQECLNALQRAQTRLASAQQGTSDDGSTRTAAADAALAVRTLLESDGLAGARAMTASELAQPVEGDRRVDRRRFAATAEVSALLAELEFSQFSPDGATRDHVRVLIDRAAQTAREVHASVTAHRAASGGRAP